VKLADFGFAKKVTAKNCLQTLCGTAQYVAPEILDSNVDGYDHRADMWSVGVVTFVLLGGYAPFDGPLEQLANTIIRGDYEFHVNSWSNISLQAKDMISAMLQVNPDRRMTADGALGCSWMEMEDGSLILSDLSSVQEQLRKTLPPTDKVKTAVQAVRFLVFWLDLDLRALASSLTLLPCCFQQIITKNKRTSLAGVTTTAKRRSHQPVSTSSVAVFLDR
jgi:calcium/calmodulin-dependent protein kinase I